MNSIYIVRHPLLDRRLEVAGFELLYHGSQAEPAVRDSDQAGAAVLLGSVIDIGLERIVGEHRAFLNVTPRVLFAGLCESFPVNQIVLQLNARDIDAATLERMYGFNSYGFQFSLENFDYEQHDAALLETADYISLNVRDTDRQELVRQMTFCEENSLTTIARSVLSHEEYESCKELGFDLFDGRFLLQPKVVTQSQLPSDRTVLLRVLAEVQNPSVDLKKLDDMIRQDVGLSHRILRFINSVRFGVPRKVESIEEATMFVGIRRIKKVVSLVLLAGVSEQPSELVTMALIRARMCEELARITKKDRSEQYFLVGLLSALDALLERSLTDLLENLPLSDRVTSALLHREGELGTTLKTVLAYENADWDQIHQSEFDSEILLNAYTDAVQWANETFDSLAAVA